MQIVASAPDGTDIYQLRLQSGGLSADILSFGATLQALRLDGTPGSLVLGHSDVTAYLSNPAYFGATVGRYANRIREGRAVIDGTPVQLDRNTQEGHLLHGGHQGASHMNWQVVACSDASATLAVTMPDGHMGFPGALDARVIYRLSGQHLEVDITAETDRPTLCSFAHHSYFNLSRQRHIADHVLQVAADHYLPTAPSGIPTGQIAPVEGTRFDLRGPTSLGDKIFDHNFCLSAEPHGLRAVACLACGDISMTVESDAPGLQVYTGDGIAAAHGPAAIGPRAGIALEPQIWPDAPNRQGFPNANLYPGDCYRQRTRFQFTTGVGFAAKSAHMKAAQR